MYVVTFRAVVIYEDKQRQGDPAGWSDRNTILYFSQRLKAEWTNDNREKIEDEAEST